MIYAIRDPRLKALLSRVFMGGSGFAKRAPMILVIAVDFRSYDDVVERHTPYVDAGIFINNLSLAAWSHGVGTCVLHLNEEDRAEIREIVDGCHSNHTPVAAVVIGIPSCVPAKPAGVSGREILVRMD